MGCLSAGCEWPEAAGMRPARLLDLLHSMSARNASDMGVRGCDAPMVAPFVAVQWRARSMEAAGKAARAGKLVGASQCLVIMTPPTSGVLQEGRVWPCVRLKHGIGFATVLLLPLLHLLSPSCHSGWSAAVSH